MTEFRKISPALAILLSLILIACGEEKKTERTGSDTGENGAEVSADTFEGQGQARRVDMSQFGRTILNVPYTENENERQTLDIVYPDTAAAPYKTVVLFHGGGWLNGNERSESLASVFLAASQGYVVVSVNYRLSGEVKWPAPLRDAKAAIRFLRANSGRFDLDTDKIVVWGASAGGHIVQMLGATKDREEFEDLSMGNENLSSAVQGVVSWYGVADIRGLPATGIPVANTLMGFDVREHPGRARNASPIALVTSEYPPILLVHGTDDEVVPFRQSAEMKEKINRVTGGETAVLVPFTGAGHRDPMIRSQRNVANNLDFVDEILFDGSNPYRHRDYRDILLVE